MRRRRLVLLLVALGAVVGAVWIAAGSRSEPGLPRYVGAAGPYRITIVLDRATTGVVAVDIGVVRRTGADVAVDEAAVSAAMPAMGHLSPELPASPAGPDRFVARGELFTMAGAWELTVRLRAATQTEVITVEVPVTR